jgi:hypothetical protein
MDKEKEFRGARYMRGTLSRFFFEFFLFRGGGQKEVYAIYERDFSHSFRKDLSLCFSLSFFSHSSLSLSFSFFLSYSYKQKKMGFYSFTSRIKKHTERDACAYRSSVLVFLRRGEKRERERKRG